MSEPLYGRPSAGPAKPAAERRFLVRDLVGAALLVGLAGLAVVAAGLQGRDVRIPLVLCAAALLAGFEGVWGRNPFARIAALPAATLASVLLASEDAPAYLRVGLQLGWCAAALFWMALTLIDRRPPDPAVVPLPPRPSPSGRGFRGVGPALLPMALVVAIIAALLGAGLAGRTPTPLDVAVLALAGTSWSWALRPAPPRRPPSPARWRRALLLALTGLTVAAVLQTYLASH